MRMIKSEGGRIVFVAGPVVIHTGGTAAFSQMPLPSTTSSIHSTAHHLGSISREAFRSRRATRTICGRSIRSTATDRSRVPSRLGSCDPA
jgi:hypothetical protein